MRTCTLTYPAPLLDYVNAPVGAGRAIAGPYIAPTLLACPTTSGTGSEVTGIAIFDLRAQHVKTGVASLRLRPSEAIVDPRCASTLPAAVVAASGMDVLCHALESYTARPFWRRARPASPTARPMSQGANPWSDLGCREALRLLGRYLVQHDATDDEARTQVMWAATLAGIAFGNAGVHVPHAMAYAVAGRVREGDGFRALRLSRRALVPHGMAVAVNAPSVVRGVRVDRSRSPSRGRRSLGADLRTAAPDDAASYARASSSASCARSTSPTGSLGSAAPAIATRWSRARCRNSACSQMPHARSRACGARHAASGGALHYW